MQENSKQTETTVIGIDVGDKHSHLCVLDAGCREVVEESRIRTTRAGFGRRFGDLAPTRIALEVGTHSGWIASLLEEVGHEVIVANPRKLALIFENDNKTDRVDAQLLARLAAADVQLLHPITHREPKTRADRGVLIARDQVVALRTALINCTRGIVKSSGERLRSGSMRNPQMRITKAGDRMLRRHLVQCANYILGPFGHDCDLRRWGMKLAQRGGKAAKKRAIVATARKLAVLLHRLWLTGESYDPHRNAPASEAA